MKKKSKLQEIKVLKISINAGVGRLSQVPHFEDKVLPEIIKEISLIGGQKPKTIGARISIAGFKIRSNQIVGLLATLRGKRMQDFLNRLINTVMPRIKDFRGVDAHNVDYGGNLNLGLKEQYVFPEISPENSKTPFGLQVTVVLNTRNREKAVEFYKKLGIPFKK